MAIHFGVRYGHTMSKKSAKGPNPWDRLPHESEAAYGAFLRFRNMGVMGHATYGGRRSLRKLSALDGRSYDVLRQWSSAFDWRERACAYDRHLDEISMETTEETVREMARRHVLLSRRMQEVSARHLEKILDGKVDEVTPRDAARLADVGFKMERLARGQSTEITEGKLDLSKLSLEDLQALKKIREKTRDK